jgi:hypothetical protein
LWLLFLAKLLSIFKTSETKGDAGQTNRQFWVTLWCHYRYSFSYSLRGVFATSETVEEIDATIDFNNHSLSF